MTEFPKRLKALRKEKKLTQTQLAEALGLQQATIAKWETGERTPFIEYFILMVLYNNVSTTSCLSLFNFAFSNLTTIFLRARFIVILESKVPALNWN